MSDYTDADVRAATKATIGHRGEQCQTGWLCQCGFTGDTASLDDHFASLVLDAVVPAIVARAKAEALRDMADDPRVTCAKCAIELNDRAEHIAP